MRMSVHIATSSPPPRQCPLIAQTTIFGVRSNLPMISFAWMTNVNWYSLSVDANIFTSAPAEKNFSDALRTTIALTAALKRASSMASERSSRKALSYELAGGRSSTMCPTASRSSSRTTDMLTSPNARARISGTI
jgi:hypothetical protein